jgi:hypothetical protein
LISQIDHKKDLVKMAGSKMTCPRWHLGQVEQGPFGVPFTNIHSKKTLFSCGGGWLLLNLVCTIEVIVLTPLSTILESIVWGCVINK